MLLYIVITAGFSCYWLHCLLPLNWFQNLGFEIGINKDKIGVNEKCDQFNNTRGVFITKANICDSFIDAQVGSKNALD